MPVQVISIFNKKEFSRKNYRIYTRIYFCKEKYKSKICELSGEIMCIFFYYLLIVEVLSIQLLRVDSLNIKKISILQNALNNIVV